MSNFASGYTLTQAGAALMADVEAGKLSLKLTRLQLGSAVASGVPDYTTRSALIVPQNYMAITSLTTEDVGDVRTCKISASLTSTAVEAGYNATELGVFAQDSSGTEILYGVCYDSQGSYIAGQDDGNNVEFDFAVRIITTSQATVELVLPQTTQEMMALIQQNANLAINAVTSVTQSAAAAAGSNAKAQLAMTTAAGYANDAENAALKATSVLTDAVATLKAEIDYGHRIYMRAGDKGYPLVSAKDIATNKVYDTTLCRLESEKPTTVTNLWLRPVG